MSILSTAFVSQWESENLIREQLENVYLEPIHIHLQTDADREWVKKLKSNEPNAGFQFNLGVALQQKYLFALALNPSYHCYPSILGQIRTYARIVLIPFYEFLKCFKSKQKSLLWMLSCLFVVVVVFCSAIRIVVVAFSIPAVKFEKRSHVCRASLIKRLLAKVHSFIILSVKAIWADNVLVWNSKMIFLIEPKAKKKH